LKQRIGSFLGGIKSTLIRIVLTLAGALFVALATFVLLAPNSVREFIEGIPLILRLLALFTIYAIAGVIIYQEFVLGGRPSVKGLIVRGNDGALTSIEPDVVRERVTSALEDVQDVEPIVVRVKANRGKAEISVGVIVRQADAKIPEKEREIIRTLRQVVEKQLGVQIDGRPKVTISVADGLRPDRPIVERQSDVNVSEQPAVNMPDSAEVEDSSEDRAFWDFLKSTSESESDDKS
jgi:uncharacterized alkaline shock family protein YloU